MTTTEMICLACKEVKENPWEFLRFIAGGVSLLAFLGVVVLFIQVLIG